MFTNRLSNLVSDFSGLISRKSSEERMGFANADVLELSTPAENCSLKYNGNLEFNQSNIGIPCDDSPPIELPSSNGQAESEKKKITEWQAAWNVTNAIQGMFIVSFPYSVLQGGYWAIIAMVLFAYITYYTGKILIECLYEEDSKGIRRRVRTSYIQLAEEVWGVRYGGKIVQSAQLIELLMTCVLYVMLCGTLLSNAFAKIKFNLSCWIMLSSMFLLPCAFLQNYRAVAKLSFWNTISHIIINVIIIGYCLTFIGSWHWDQIQWKIDIYSAPVALGLIVFSYTSQIFLPALEGSMEDRNRFECMLGWSHGLAAFFKAGFSCIGFLTFGTNTAEVITTNLPENSFQFWTNMFLFFKALLSYPLPYFAACDIVQNRFFEIKGDAQMLPSCYASNGAFKAWAVFLRLLVVIVTVLFAIYIPHFTLLMGLIGNFTGTMLSFVWPCYFHMCLKGYSLPKSTIIWELTIIIIGILFGGLGIYYSGIGLISALKND